MHAIAAKHGGAVPLHGRQFAQWLHFAFPLACPFPAVLEDVVMLSRESWNATKGIAAAEEQARHISNDVDSVGKDIIDEAWSEEEILPLAATSHWLWAWLGRSARALIIVCMGGVIVSSAVKVSLVASPGVDGKVASTEGSALHYA